MKTLPPLPLKRHRCLARGRRNYSIAYISKTAYRMHFGPSPFDSALRVLRDKKLPFSGELPHLILALSARVNGCTALFSSMAMLQLSNWSACRYLRSDLGHSGAKYVLLLAKCRYSRCCDTRRILCGSKWRRVLGKKSMSL